MKLIVELKNCYGINKLKHDFVFSNSSYSRIISIYVGNGIMKTSFTKTFLDYASDWPSSDMIFEEKKTEVSIKMDTVEFPREHVFVINSFEESYSWKCAGSLLVNEECKENYENAAGIIIGLEAALLKKLKNLSGHKKQEDIKIIIEKDFDKGDLHDILADIDFSSLTSQLPENIKYTDIFNEQTNMLLKDKDFLSEANTYSKTYQELIKKSKYLRSDFSHNNIEDVHKNLKTNKFFAAQHQIQLFDKQGGLLNEPISNQEDLLKKIEEDKQMILQDKELSTQFKKIDKQCQKNTATKTLRKVLVDNPSLLKELSDIDLFKRKLWMQYLYQCSDDITKFVSEYSNCREKIEEIINLAAAEQPHWKKVIKLFNNRFIVPFHLVIKNQSDVIIGGDAPSVEFMYTDSDPNGGSVSVKQDTLREVLSQGEKRVLYLLNIIFRIEELKAGDDINNQKTLIIVDDIADSFDYKNKYAIIEYLRDIVRKDNFYMIILSHNYDFHREIKNRLNIDPESNFVAIKTSKKIFLQKENNSKNILKDWLKNLHTGQIKFIACIPFARNIAELTNKKDDYDTLTKLLHIKKDTKDILASDLHSIYKSVFNIKANIPAGWQEKKVLTILNSVVENIKEVASKPSSQKDVTYPLENKIVLAMGIRLVAEDFIINVLKLTDEIKNNQTRELVRLYKDNYPEEEGNIEILERVNMMTPGCIHLNSFMFEPILDMSIDCLVRLHNDVCSLELGVLCSNC